MMRADTSELTAERRRLMGRQQALAATINSYYPRAVGSARSAGEESACAEAQRNTKRIREIDALLDGVAG